MIAEKIGVAHELIAVFVGQVDVQGKLGHLLRLDQRKLGDAAVLPLHAIDVEVLPHPVGAAVRLGEVIAGDRRFQRLASLDGKSQLCRVAGDVTRLDRLLVGAIRLMIADDFLDADSALCLDVDGLLRDLRLLGVIESEEKRTLDRLDADEEVAAFATDVGRFAIAGCIDLPRTGVKIAGQRRDRRCIRQTTGHNDRAKILAAHEREDRHLYAISLHIEHVGARGRVERVVTDERAIEVDQRGKIFGSRLRQIGSHGAVAQRTRQVVEGVRRLRSDDGVNLFRRIVGRQPCRSGGDVGCVDEKHVDIGECAAGGERFPELPGRDDCARRIQSLSSDRQPLDRESRGVRLYRKG